jgi:hypothetical protein
VVVAGVLFEIGIWIFSIGCLAAVGIPGWQTFNWLQTGVWERVPVMLLWRQIGVSPYLTNWVGLQQIIFEALDMPVAFALFVGAALIAAGLVSLGCAVSR